MSGAKELAQIIRGVAHDEKGRPLPLTPAEAMALAEEVLETLFSSEEWPRMLERSGLRFVAFLPEEWELGSPALVFAQQWDGQSWVNLGRVEVSL
ncbi:MAG: hypothetical protein QJR00_02010 [Bacillota bacterium]|nr:hypothetical protein [Bacillota bacterium]